MLPVWKPLKQHLTFIFWERPVDALFFSSKLVSRSLLMGVQNLVLGCCAHTGEGRGGLLENGTSAGVHPTPMGRLCSQDPNCYLWPHKHTGLGPTLQRCSFQIWIGLPKAHRSSSLGNLGHLHDIVKSPSRANMPLRQNECDPGGIALGPHSQLSSVCWI